MTLSILQNLIDLIFISNLVVEGCASNNYNNYIHPSRRTIIFGAIIFVHYSGVSTLEGLCGMYVSYNWDPEICSLYRGVRYRGVSIKCVPHELLHQSEGESSVNNFNCHMCSQSLSWQTQPSLRGFFHPYQSNPGPDPEIFRRGGGGVAGTAYKTSSIYMWVLFGMQNFN